MGKDHKEYTWNLVAKKLAGEATPEELKELDDLLRNNPDLHYPLQTITDVWRHSSPVDIKQVEEAFNRHLDRLELLNIDYSPMLNVVSDGSKRSSIRRKLLIGIPIVLILTGVTMLLMTRPTAGPQTIAAVMPQPSDTRDIHTTVGSRTSLSLPDGTRVWLNAGSDIQYGKDFGRQYREVTLTGEAFFDVAPDAAHPFVIHTKKVDIRVLGTSFNLKSYPTDKTTEATLIRGSIEVSIRNRPTSKIILKPNEKLVVNNDDSLLFRGPSRRREVPPQSLVVISKPTYELRSGAIIETSWVDNKLIFQDEEFGNLAKQMERWYGVSIQFENPRMEELRFTGSFDKETIRQALNALKLTDQTPRFDFTIDGNLVTIHN